MRTVLFALCTLSTVVAQQVSEQRFYYPVPAPGQVNIRTAVNYTTLGGTPLVMDFYLPATVPEGRKLPVMIFLNGFGGDSQRHWPVYQGWAKAATACAPPTR